MHFYYSAAFNLDLPESHRFPGHKYELLRQYLLSNNIVAPEQLHLSPEADETDIFLAHTEDYYRSLCDGSIDRAAMRRIGFPWSPQIAPRGRRTVGGAIAAAKTALQHGLSGQLAGGTHHAHAGFGSGYCILNDFAVVARKALQERWVERLAIIDLDVHQGDGNAAILNDDPRIFILDAFGEKNFPFRKVPTTLDLPFPDNPGDEAYLETIATHLDQVWQFAPDLVLYQAGVDPLHADKLGRMDISFDGLMERDRMVLQGCWQRGIPCSMGIGGGYANPIDPTVEAYANTYRVAKEVYGF